MLLIIIYRPIKLGNPNNSKTTQLFKSDGACCFIAALQFKSDQNVRGRVYIAGGGYGLLRTRGLLK